MNLDTQIQFIAKFRTVILDGPYLKLRELGLTEEEASAIVSEKDLINVPKVQDTYTKWLLAISSNIIKVVDNEKDNVSDSGGGDT